MAIAAADLDGDGHPDLALANEVDNTVSVLLGRGDGTFHGRVDYATGEIPFDVTVGDFTGDGLPDLLTANLTGSGISVLPNLRSPVDVRTLPAPRFSTRVFPNPALDFVRIEFTLRESSAVSLTIHDLQGRVVAEMPGRTLPAGVHGYDWRPRSEPRRPPGIYLCRIRGEGFSVSLPIAVLE